MKEEKHKDLLKATEDAEQNGMGGAHTDTLLCSDRFNVFVLQKFFFSYVCTVYQNIHVLNVKVDIIQIILWYKNMNIYNHQPRIIRFPHPAPL